MQQRIVSLVPNRSALRVAKRVLVGATLVAVGYLAALVAPAFVGISDAVSIDSAAAVKHAAADATRVGATSPAAAAGESRDFDYFPDHYQNQAKEASEPPDTF
jgi:hypothetical protein